MSGEHPAWDEQALYDDPHAAADKAVRVRRMFAAIAGSYDLNNRLHSLGRDQAWRKAAVRMAQLRAGDRVVDVACGTGDLTLALAKVADQPVLGVDFTYEMLPRAVGKVEKGVRPLFVQGDAMRLPLADASADVVSIAFGIRNVADPGAALREFVRVLRPGGRLVVLEFSEPSNPVIRRASKLWTDHVMPRTASWIARDRSGAYRYLPRSVGTFWDRQQLQNAMAGTGLGEVVCRPMTFGVACVYRGVRGAQ